MASLKGNRVTEGSQARRNVGVGAFKVHSENENIKVDENSKFFISARESLVPARNKFVSVSKGATLASASDSKGSLRNVEKGKGKRYSSTNSNVGRKALADVSNFSRNAMHDGSKPMKGKSERSAFLQRVSLGPGAKAVNVSSRKSVMGKVKENLSQGVGDMHTSKRGVKDIKASSNYQTTKTNNSSQESVVDGRTARNSLIATRKSLPVLKRVNKPDASNAKGSAESSGEAKEMSAFPVKAKVGKKVVPKMSSARNHLWRNRASDGYIIMAPRTNVDACALSRKSIKPIVKSTLRASNAQKSKFEPALNKSKYVASITSKKVEVVTSLPKNNAFEVSNEATQDKPSNDGNRNPSTNSSDTTARRKSDRRRSYTSFLMARSKLLEEHGEVMKQEKLPNIDDGCNQLEVAEYVDEIYQYYWVAEAQLPSPANYMSIQADITPHMRGILINWLIEVHFKFDLMQETLYLMVTLLDQYLSQVNIEKNEMQLVGLTSLLLASKYEDFWHPRIKDLISISAETYTRGQVLAMEKLILRKLKFRLNAPTPYVFMLRFLKAARSDTKLEHLAFYLIELCLVEYEALKFKPSLLCASAIYVARCTLQMTPAWTSLLGKHARYDVPQIRNCAEMILRFQKTARSGQLKVTYEKYMGPDLSGVAAIKPLDSLPF